MTSEATNSAAANTHTHTYSLDNLDFLFNHIQDRMNGGHSIAPGYGHVAPSHGHVAPGHGHGYS